MRQKIGTQKALLCAEGGGERAFLLETSVTDFSALGTMKTGHTVRARLLPLCLVTWLRAEEQPSLLFYEMSNVRGNGRHDAQVSRDWENYKKKYGRVGSPYRFCLTRVKNRKQFHCRDHFFYLCIH